MLSTCANTVVAVALTFFALKIDAGLLGYEQYINLPGKFWVWGSNGVTIIDPVTTRVTKDISCPSSRWGDATFIRDQAEIKHLVFANDYANDQVYVYDALSETVQNRIQLLPGTKPLHLYAVYYYDQVWVHGDGPGRFDVFRTAQVRYRGTAGVQASPTNAGHGKLMAGPNLEDAGFCTNVNSPAVIEVNVPLRQKVRQIDLLASNLTQGVRCRGTHGIDFSPTNNMLYVECTNPASCSLAKTKADKIKNCTGSTWVVDAIEGKVKARLTSPYLNTELGPNFGVQGQPTRSPEATFMFMSNAANNVVHITLPLASGETKIIALNLEGPGIPMWYAKDPSIQYGVDRNASNYVAMIPVKTGLAFVDMQAIVLAFAKGLDQLPTSVASVVTYATGGSARTMKNGGNYAIGASYSSSTATNGIAIINVRTRTVKYIYDVAPGVSRFQWVPIFHDEVVTQVRSLAAIINANGNSSVATNTELRAAMKALQVKTDAWIANSDPSSYEKDTRDGATGGIILGSIALICSIVAMILGCVALCKPVSGGLALSGV